MHRATSCSSLTTSVMRSGTPSNLVSGPEEWTASCRPLSRPVPASLMRRGHARLTTTRFGQNGMSSGPWAGVWAQGARLAPLPGLGATGRPGFDAVLVGEGRDEIGGARGVRATGGGAPSTPARQEARSENSREQPLSNRANHKGPNSMLL